MRRRRADGRNETGMHEQGRRSLNGGLVRAALLQWQNVLGRFRFEHALPTAERAVAAKA